MSNNFLSDIKQAFTDGNSLNKLIHINAGLFAVVFLAKVILQLFNIHSSWMLYVELPASFSLFIKQPWSIFSYMFLHANFIHLLFNLLLLYGFGRIFLSFFSQRHLVGLYLLGGLTGGMLYMISFNIFPYFSDRISASFLIGASASVMAVIFGVASYRPNTSVRLVFIGEVKLKYLALVLLLLDLLSVTSLNAGGHIAHLGGALAGFLFGYYYQKGTDITAFINKIIDFFVDLFKRQPKMKVSKNPHKRPETDQEYRNRKANETKELDAILDKIKKSGYNNLTAEEKKRLFDVSQKK